MASPRVVQATADGPSKYLQMQPIDGISTVSISAASYDPGVSITLEGSVDGRFWAVVKDNGSPIVVTNQNWIGIVEGNGVLRMNVTGYGTTSGLEMAVSDK